MKKSKNLGFIFLRYLSLILIGCLIFQSGIFYSLFLKLTIYPVNWLLNLFISSRVIFDTLMVNGLRIEIISACIAVSAYFLLIAINLVTPMKPLKRVYVTILSCLLLLGFNILRIFILALLYINGNLYLDIIHKTLWYSLNLIIVVLIWFSLVKFFKIKLIPVYNDFLSIWALRK
jgi:exosortase/archaeosortase family protein